TLVPNYFKVLVIEDFAVPILWCFTCIEQKAAWRYKSDFVGYLMSNIHEKVIDRLVTCSFCSFLIRRIAYDCVKFHVVVVICFPKRLSLFDFSDKIDWSMGDLIDHVFKIACVYLGISKAY